MIAHAMAAGLLPAGVIEAIDKRRRAFFWAGEESCNGGQCKVAWGDVCTPKNKGGLIILSIPAQNPALLSKFLIKLHSTQMLRGLVGSDAGMAGPASVTWVTPTSLTLPSGKISSQVLPPFAGSPKSSLAMEF
jgi:hypothetical protein